MKRTYHKLGVKQVEKAVREAVPGKGRMFADGDGLYLCISRASTASWIYRYMLAGKIREMASARGAMSAWPRRGRRLMPPAP